jgi:hypothetical protein
MIVRDADRLNVVGFLATLTVLGMAQTPFVQ